VITRDHPVAACGEGPRERLVHPPAEQQAVEQDDGAVALAELLIRQSLAQVGECRHNEAG
jgi:hypothetical protein